MNKLFSFITTCILVVILCQHVMAQTEQYSFISKDLHLLSDKDSAQFEKINKSNIDFNEVTFYTTDGTVLDLMSAITKLQDTSNKTDLFIDDSGNIKAMVIGALAKTEINTPEIKNDVITPAEIIPPFKLS